MARIQVGSTTTTYNRDGSVESVEKTPSYLIQEDGTKVELTDEQAKQYGIGVERGATTCARHPRRPSATCTRCCQIKLERMRG